MGLLIFLWILTFIFALLALRTFRGNPKYIFKKQLDGFEEKVEKEGSLFEKIGHIKYFSDPGFVVKKSVNESKIKAKLLVVGQIITFRAFLGVKQFILTIFSFYFWLYIWFGDVTWDNTGKFFLLLLLAFYLPDLWLQVKKEKRLKMLDDEVPYFMDLLSLTLQTGMNIDQALKHTAEHKKGIVAEVIKKKLGELKFGRSIDDILVDIKKMLPNDELCQFINAISRAKKLGVSLASTLEIQSKLIRTKRRQRAEELSRTAAVKISLPLVLFIFPALLIIYIGPGLLRLMQ